MVVYIVIEERDMSSFTDQDGDSALDSKEIMGVCSTMEKALALVDSLAAANARDVAEFDCDECKYWACPYEVKE